MKTRSPFLIALAALASLSIAIPHEILAQTAQKAGEVSRAIPDVNLSRGTQQMPAPIKTLVDWGDVVHTGDGGRARVSLDDGSVLNVGSSSSLTVTQHDAKAQQTQIELEYGRMRSQVVKQSKPNAKFEIHTATGVAGVVGTDLGTSFMNGIFHLVVYDGTVRFCNLDNVCVTVTAGMMSTIRDGHQPPDQPSPATPSDLTEMTNGTSVGTTIPVLPVHHIGIWTIVGLTVAVAVPAIAIPIATRGSHPPPQTGCKVVASAC